MAKGVQAEDIIQSIKETQGEEAARSFAAEVKKKGGVDIQLNISPGKARRKRKWFVQGKPVTIRLSDTVYRIMAERARSNDLPIGVYGRRLLERDLTRSHHKQKGK